MAERSDSTLRYRLKDPIRIVSVTVIRPRVEVYQTSAYSGSSSIEVLSQERVSDSFEPIRLELHSKMVENRVRSMYVLARSTNVACRSKQ